MCLRGFGDDLIRSNMVTAILSIIGAGVLVFLGCSSKDSSEIRRDAVDSPFIQTALSLQESLLAGPPPPASRAHEVRRFSHYIIQLANPDSQADASDSFFREWAASPDCVLLTEVAFINASQLGGSHAIEPGLVAAAGSDSSAAIYHFVHGRRKWGRQSGAGQAFRRAAELAELTADSLTAVWSSLRASRLEADEGRVDEAVAGMTNALPLAWRVGGPILATILWRELSFITRRADRLNDALAAARMAECCATAAEDLYQRTRARISLANAQFRRGLYAVAADILTDCYKTAVDNRYIDLQVTTSGLLQTVANAAGDLDVEENQLRKLLEVTTASADTNRMVRAGVALASSMRRYGDISAAQDLFAWCDTVNTAWSAGNLDYLIQQERAILLNQMGRYAEAESLRMTLGEDPQPERRRESTLLQQIHLIRQGLETNRPDLAYRALARAEELDPASLPPSLSFDGALHLALAAARLHARQGEHILADAQLQIAKKRAARGNLRDAWFIANTVGHLALESGDDDGAHQAFADCVDLAEALGEADLLRRSRIRLSTTLLEGGRFAAAESLVVGDLTAPEYWTWLNAHLVTGMARAGLGDHRAALAAYAAVDSILGASPPADLAARLDLERGRSFKAQGRYRDAYTRLISAREELSVSALASTDLGRAFNRQIRRETAEALLSLLYDHPQLAGPEGANAVSRTIAAWFRGTAPIQTQGPRIEYFLGKERAFAWSTDGRRGEVRWLEVLPVAGLSELTRSVTTDMAYPGREVDFAAANRLGQALLEPLRGQWPAGTVLEIAPDGFLASLPWNALPWPGIAATILDHGPIVITAGSPAGPDAGAAVEGLLVVGVDSGGEATSIRLTQAEAEARAVADAWHGGLVDLRLGADGFLASLLPDGLRGYRAVHISSHTRVYEGLDGHSTIHVAGQSETPLTIEQIAAARIDAELIYLSSCEGARRHRSPGRGVLSFADAFLAAGSRSVVASSVPVDDEAGRFLAESFYRHWLDGEQVATALRFALLELRDSNLRWSHPFFWGFTNQYTRPSG